MNKEQALEFLQTEINKGSYSGTHPEEIENNLLDFTIISEEGGEGQGDRYTLILRVPTDDGLMLVRVNAHYESNNGTDFSYADVEEVEEYQRTKTAYRPVTKNTDA